ncbi:GGDEF domain-containing protein [Lactiplantibacillus mudanjiangensis]|nr:GGDEF domain-containing protein [Lactiplantibacillus mudanjiangensis]
MQLVYGGAWWLIVWTIKPFPLWYLFNDLVMFSAYMWFIHWLVKRLTAFIDHLVHLDQQANYDELTGIRNRANFDSISASVFDFYQTRQLPVTVVMFDIDHFKQFNDQYGHLTGDQVLKHITHLFEQRLLKVTSHGQLFRYGGEEFVILFRGLTASDVQKIMVSIVQYGRQTPLVVDGQSLNITVSMGITALQPTDPDFNTWLNRVDKALYQAKQQGRNRVTTEKTTQTFDD